MGLRAFISLWSVHRRGPSKAGLSSATRSRAKQLTPTDFLGQEGAGGLEVESWAPNKIRMVGANVCGSSEYFERGLGDIMFGKAGKQLENSPKTERKTGQALSKWLSHLTKLFLVQRR